MAGTPLSGRLKYYAVCTARVCLILLVLFVYICCLSNMSTAFNLLASRGLGKAIKESPLINDPISAVTVGMLATVILQSASVATNILVTMVAANMITVHDAIPVMIGSELGSSLVNVMVSLAYSGDPIQFRRAFSAAILGDVFNVCSLMIILPMELLTGVIEKLSWLIVDPLISEQGLSFKTLELLTDPFNQFIIMVNDVELLNATIRPEMFAANHSFIERCVLTNDTKVPNCVFDHIFAYSNWSDKTIGAILLVISLFLLIFCLISIVYLIQKLLEGHAARSVRSLLSKQCPGRCSPCTGYSVMAVGLVVTILVQSNSIFSSSLTPLVGSGVVTLEQMYPLVLGSNIGTTFSGVLAAFSQEPTRFEKALHMAMCQVVYNVVGTLLFYIVPLSRRLPIYLAENIGRITERYRWFIVVLIITFFIAIPFTIIGLSLLPEFVLSLVFVLIMIFIGLCVGLSCIQNFYPQVLPEKLRTWEFIPKRCRSLKPYDEMMSRWFQKIPYVGSFFKRELSNRESNNSVVMSKIQTEV